MEATIFLNCRKEQKKSIQNVIIFVNYKFKFLKFSLKLYLYRFLGQDDVSVPTRYLLRFNRSIE